MFNTKKFKVTLDAQGRVAYGIDIIGSKKFTATYELDAIGDIPLTPDDQYALFIASGGAIFQVSYDITFPVIQLLPAGMSTVITQNEDTLGVSLIDLRPWLSNKHTNLFIKALNAMTMTVNIYSGVK